MSKPARFEALDGWRGVTALVIAVYHVPAFSHVYASQFIRHTFLLVDFFFVLSGFVLAHAYGEKLRSAGAFLGFFLRRFGRIWPLHVFILAAFVLYELMRLALSASGVVSFRHAPFSGQYSADTILPNVLMVHSLGFTAPSWNVPSWSISVEFWTYMTLALVLILASSVAPSAGARKIAIIVGAAIVAALGAGVVVFLSPAGIDTSFRFGLFRCFYGFFVGVLVYEVWKVTRGSERALPYLEWAAFAFVLAYIVDLGATRWTLLAPLVFGAGVWIFAHEAGPLSRLLRSRLFAWLGALSYSIYMAHVFVIQVAIDVLKLVERGFGLRIFFDLPEHGHGELVETVAFASPYAGDVLLVVLLPIVVGMAFLTHRFVEGPGRRFFNRLAAQHETARIETVVPAATPAASL